MVPVAEAPERLVLNTKVVFADLRKARWMTVRACSWLLNEGCDYDKEFFLAMSWMVNEVGLGLAAKGAWHLTRKSRQPRLTRIHHHDPAITIHTVGTSLTDSSEVSDGLPEADVSRRLNMPESPLKILVHCTLGDIRSMRS